ncbi:MAG: TRAP transporter small permease [Desulfobacula sp.]|nr:TRAP transporter small permease [Desulfobacula sp.]
MIFFEKIGRIIDMILIGFAWLSGILMIFSLVSVCIDVVMRYFFNNPSGWILQISEYILLYIPFLSAAYVLKEDGHIKVDILLNFLGKRAEAVLNTVTSILGACVLFILTYYGTIITYDFYVRKVPTLKYLKIPEFLIIIVIPVGCFMFALQFIRRANNYYQKFKNETDKHMNRNKRIAAHTK